MSKNRTLRWLALSGSLLVLTLDVAHANDTDFDANPLLVAPRAVAFATNEISDAVKMSTLAYHAYDESSSNPQKAQRLQEDLADLNREGFSNIAVLKGETGNSLYRSQSNLGVVAQRGDALHVAFRGTKFGSLADILTDLTFWKNDFNGLGQAHTGFSNAYASVEGQLKEVIMPLIKSGQVKTLYFEGHSLGAALARLAAVKLADQLGKNTTIKCTTFNEPRSGDQKLAEASDRLLGTENHARLVKGRDALGSGANIGLLGNKHSGTKIVIPEAGYNPVKQHSLDNFRNGAAEDAVLQHNTKPTKVDGIRTTVQKALTSAKDWVVDKAKNAISSVAAGYQAAKAKVTGWFGW